MGLRRPAAALALALAASISCVGGYQYAEPDVSTHADLRHIYFRGATTLSEAMVPKGRVHAKAVGERRDPFSRNRDVHIDGTPEEDLQRRRQRLHEDCLAAAIDAMLGLLEEARSLGGNAVYDVESLGRRGWISRSACRIEPEAVAVELRGVAVRIADHMPPTHQQNR